MALSIAPLSNASLCVQEQQEQLRQKNEREYLRRVFQRIHAGGDKAKEVPMRKGKVHHLDAPCVKSYLRSIGYEPTAGEGEKYEERRRNTKCVRERTGYTWLIDSSSWTE